MAHVIVIGAGVVGLCTADELLARGFRVTVLDDQPQPGSACSYGNGGLIVPSHFTPLAAPGMISMGLRMMRDPKSPFGLGGVPSFETLSWMARFAMSAKASHVAACAPVLRDMHLLSRSLFETNYPQESAASEYEHAGEYLICRTEQALEKEKHLGDQGQKLGLKTRVLDRRQLQAEEPNCEIDAAGAVYFEDDGKVHPPKFLQALGRRLTSKGAEIVPNSSVTGFQRETFTVKCVETGAGRMEADAFVIAAGAWSGKLAKLLGLNLPLLAGKGYGFTVTEPPQKPRLPALLIEGRLAVTPFARGLRFVGTMELEPPGSLGINPARVQGMCESIPQYYPAFRDFDFAATPIWAGLRPCSPDGMPYLGRTKRFQNLFFATGHGMMGMSLGPVSGRIVAQAVANEPTCIQSDLLSPDRYA